MTLPTLPRRRLLTATLLGGLLTATTLPARAEAIMAAGQRPKDVAATAVFAQEITWAASTGIIPVYPDGTYRQAEVVTRAKAAEHLYRLAGSPSYQAPARSFYTDVPVTHLQYRVICWVTDAGLSNGYTDGTYRPNAALQRDAVAAFLYRLAGAPTYTAPSISPFTDMTSSTALYREVCWMNETRLAQGYADGTFQPTKPVTREILAPFLYRYTQRITT